MPIKIFFCYAREDEILLNKLKTHLKSLQRQGIIDVWYDRDINAGAEWEQEINYHLNAAHIILLLISPDFMNSDYCSSVEMKQAIERHKQGGACVIPVILRPVHWQEEPLNILQALPTGAKPVKSWPRLDDALFDVASGIRKVIKKLENVSLVQGDTHAEEHPTIFDPAIPLPLAFALVGRELDLARIKQRLRSAGNIGLTALNGLPGVGKTALAVTLAHDPELRSYFSDGVLWAGLGRNPNMLGLLSRWGSLLGIPATQMATLSGNEAWARAIRAAISTRKMLLVIDDAWQLEEALAVRVGGPNCAHLVTTRFPAIAAYMAVGGAMTIGELNEKQSIQLLERLAPQVVSRETQKVLDLVHAVRGLPLALTLLGNYLRKQAYSGSARRVSTTLERLNDAEVRLQISEPHTLVESHPSLPVESSLSLQSVIAITDQLLPAPAQMALYRLSVFPSKPNTFSEEAALAVTASTFDELDLLSDIGFLENYGDRCTLHQVISDYAHIHLRKQEEHDANARLITYIADYVEAHKKDYELLDLESNIIYAVLSKAYEQGKQTELIRVVCAIAPFLILRGFYQEIECHLKRAHQAAQALSDEHGLTGTLLYLGEIEQRRGNYVLAESYLQQGLTLARLGNNQERICALLTELGTVLQQQGHFQQAETAYQEGLTLARKSTDQRSHSILLNKLGWLNMKRGEYIQSEGYLQEGLALARKIEDHERIDGLLRMLGALEIYRGNYILAQSYLQEGLTIARSLGDSEHICAFLDNLGLVAALQGKNAQAKSSYQEGLELARRIGHREKICHLLDNLGDAFVEEGNYVQAETSFQEGLEVARQIGHRERISTLLLNLAMVARKQGYYNEAKVYLQESLALAKRLSQPHIMGPILCEFGEISLSEGKIDLADHYFKEMLEQISSGDQEGQALAYYGLARVCALQRDKQNASIYGNKSVTIFETMGYRQAADVREWMKSVLD